ncbi:MAG TPA: efflux RND transporter periplasmic adaptor subunit [Chthoniobacteraceae bacterium]|jgi:RND family efflux transporter MFP subunit|nr:efflux RND transporter periplasmic adaptor subunit [Chthoniobacteraceae bacterium]
MKPVLFVYFFFAWLTFTRAEDVQGLVLPIKQVSVSSPVLQEVIEHVLVEEGDAVKADQVILELRREKEELEVQQAQQVVEQRRFTAEGAQKLFNEKIGSKEVALERQTELKLAQIQLRQAEVRLMEKTIRAPLAGIVVKKYKEAGEAVDRVEKLMDIVNIDQVYVQFYLDPKLMAAMRQDTEIGVRFPVIGPERFTGTVAFIDPRIDAGSGLFRVKLLMENQDHKIKAGMRGTADFAKLSAAR